MEEAQIQEGGSHVQFWLYPSLFSLAMSNALKSYSE